MWDREFQVTGPGGVAATASRHWPGVAEALLAAAEKVGHETAEASETKKALLFRAARAFDHASDKARAEQEARAAAKAQGGQRIFASPLARRLAEQKGVELSAITGTGMTDVLRALRDVIVAASVGEDTALPNRSVPVQEFDEDVDE